MASQPPVWFITGASSGFGAAIANEALKRGHHVVASARSAKSLGDLKAAGAAVMDVDVTASDAELASKLEEAAAFYGGITYVINCAGYLLEGAVEEASGEESAAIFRTNVLGAVNITKASLPHLRRAAAATSSSSSPEPVLAHFGSVGSWGSGPAAAHYCSTKFAVTGLTEGIATEVAEFGIKACVIEPGYFRTGFLNTPGTDGREHRARVAKPLAVYDGTAVAQMRAGLDAYNNRQPGDVVKGAKVIVDVFTKSGIAEGREIPIRLVLGSDCVEGIKKKIRDTLKLLEEWDDVARSTDYDA